jgi:arylsulfatase
VFSDNPFVSMVDNGLRNGFDHVSTQTTAPFPDALNPVSLAPELDGDIERWSYLREALRSGRPLRSLANGILWKLDQDHPALVPRSLYGGIYTTGAAHVDAFLDWAAADDAPFAAVINAMDAHSPYDPAREFDQWSDGRTRRVRDEVTLSHGVDDSIQWAMGAHEAGYDGAIRGLDAALESLVAGLRDAGRYDDTLLVVTADHGEGFGESSPVDGSPTYLHGQSVHEALLHVPLVVKPPGGTDRGRVSEPASVTRVADAVRAATSGEPLPPFVPEDGPVVASSVIDGTEYTAAYVEAGDRLLKHVFADERHAFTEHVATPWCAYEMPADPRFEDVVGTVEPVDVAGEERVDVDANVERRLEELGYQ